MRTMAWRTYEPVALPRTPSAVAWIKKGVASLSPCPVAKFFDLNFFAGIAWTIPNLTSEDEAAGRETLSLNFNRRNSDGNEFLWTMYVMRLPYSPSLTPVSRSHGKNTPPSKSRISITPTGTPTGPSPWRSLSSTLKSSGMFSCNLQEEGKISWPEWVKASLIFGKFYFWKWVFVPDWCH